MARTSGTRIGNGVGKGDGWGGPPKGADPAHEPMHAPFAVGNSISSLPVNARTELRRHRAAEMEDTIYRLAVDAEREETRLAAATKLHAIYEGTPVARTVTFTANELSDLDDAALEVRREALEAKLRGDPRGTSEAPSGKPN